MLVGQLQRIGLVWLPAGEGAHGRRAISAMQQTRTRADEIRRHPARGIRLVGVGARAMSVCEPHVTGVATRKSSSTTRTPHHTPRNPVFPTKAAGVARTDLGLTIGGVRHEFHDEANGFRARPCACDR